jgi:hypothetical protein
MASLSYPMTRYSPPPITDLTSKDARKRLSASALKLFFNIVDVWKIRDEDARMLLGGVTNGPYYEMKKKPEVRCVFRSMWAGDSIRCGHLILFDVGSYSVVMWAAFAVLP